MAVGPQSNDSLLNFNPEIDYSSLPMGNSFAPDAVWPQVQQDAFQQNFPTQQGQPDTGYVQMPAYQQNNSYLQGFGNPAQLNQGLAMPFAQNMPPVQNMPPAQAMPPVQTMLPVQSMPLAPSMPPAQPLPSVQQPYATNAGSASSGSHLVSNKGCTHANSDSARQAAHIELCNHLFNPDPNKRKQYDCAHVGGMVTDECIDDLLAGDARGAKEKFRRRAQRSHSQKGLRDERKITKEKPKPRPKSQKPVCPPRTHQIASRPAPSVSLDQASDPQAMASSTMPPTNHTSNSQIMAASATSSMDSASNLQMPPSDFDTFDPNFLAGLDFTADIVPSRIDSPFRVEQEDTMPIAEQASQCYPMDSSSFLPTPPEFPDIYSV